MKDKQWLDFNELEVPNRKTHVFEVRNVKTDFFLGTIEWDCGWRQYIHLPTAERHKMAKSCLKEIYEFIDELMEARK